MPAFELGNPSATFPLRSPSEVWNKNSGAVQRMRAGRQGALFRESSVVGRGGGDGLVGSLCGCVLAGN